MNAKHFFRLLLPVIVVTTPIAILYQSCGSSQHRAVEYMDVDGEATDAQPEDLNETPASRTDDGGAEDLPSR